MNQILDKILTSGLATWYSVIAGWWIFLYISTNQDIHFSPATFMIQLSIAISLYGNWQSTRSVLYGNMIIKILVKRSHLVAQLLYLYVVIPVNFLFVLVLFFNYLF